jgi:hypothetical protein
VRVHTDEAADLAARALGARAFAIGEDIFFARGAYDPAGIAGQRLIAHEVAHVVQSRMPDASRTEVLAISEPGDAHEREADDFAERFPLTGAASFPALSAGTDLRGASLLRSSLCDATLARADLRDADLRKAYLVRADLTGAELTGAKLAGATLAGATLEGARADWIDIGRDAPERLDGAAAVDWLASQARGE